MVSTYTYTHVGVICDKCNLHEEWPSFKEACEIAGWSLGSNRDEPNDSRDLCASCFEEER